METSRVAWSGAPFCGGSCRMSCVASGVEVMDFNSQNDVRAYPCAGRFLLGSG